MNLTDLIFRYVIDQYDMKGEKIMTLKEILNTLEKIEILQNRLKKNQMEISGLEVFRIMLTCQNMNLNLLHRRFAFRRYPGSFI